MDNMEAEKLVKTLADTLIKAKNEPFRQPLSEENAWALVDFLADTLTEAVTETRGDTLVDM